MFIKYEQFDIQGINGVEKMLTFFWERRKWGQFFVTLVLFIK